MDFGRGILVPFADLVEEMIEMITPDAEELGCVPHVERARDIVKEGTSADRQIQVVKTALAEGASNDEALRKLVQYLIADTQHGLAPTS